MSNWRDYLCRLLGCSADCEKTAAKLKNCLAAVQDATTDLAAAEEAIKQLKLLVPRPKPPIIDYVVERDTAWVQMVLTQLDAKVVRLPLGPEFRMTDKDTFIDFIAWNWVDSFDYHKFYRCGNFAVSFKADADQWGVNQVGIVLDYVSGHAYNIVVFPDGKVMLLEPQSDNLFFHGEHAPQFYNLKGAFVVI